MRRGRSAGKPTVVDTSVLAALAFNEPRADEAASILKERACSAPTLLAYELTSVARRKVDAHPEMRDAITSALDDALSLGIELVDVEQRASLDLALRFALTTYDAAYLALAFRRQATLATFDVTLARAATRFGVELASAA